MAYQGVEPAPLLPPSLKGWLKGWLGKISGYLILLALAAGSVSLLSWSATDPSLTHATSAGTRNMLGPIGAILSDLIMQSLGLGGVFAFLPPMFWALQLITSKGVPGLRAKAAFALLALVCLAAALSSLPVASGWPLRYGYGGALGDLTLDLLARLLIPINPDRAWAAAGLFYFAAGMMVLMSSLGLSQQDLRLLCQHGTRLSFAGLAAQLRRMGDLAYARRETVLVAGPEPGGFVPSAASVVRREPTRRPPARDEHATSPPVHAGDGFVGGRGVAFDQLTERTSRAIAERFAPEGADAPSDSPAWDDADHRWDEPDSRADAVAVPGTRRPEAAYRRPPLSMLKRPPAARSGADLAETALRGQAQHLKDVLADFGVKGEVKSIHPGPVVTLFEFEPARGIKSARVVGLADDIARSMGATCARVAVVPGRNAMGIELPNARREPVYLRELLESEAFRAADALLPLALGKSIAGTAVFADLARMPHLLVAGTTGSGKSVGVNAMILSLIYRLSPEQCRLLLIDPKMLELSIYDGIPHLLAPVVTDPRKAVAALEWVVREMETRYERMAKLSVRNIDVFNNRVRAAQRRADLAASRDVDLEPMPYIVVVVDEFADLMLVAGKEIETAIQRLAQMARAAGIHLIMATQRPSVDVVTGTIKANFPTRISFKVASKIDSRTILNEQGAEQLLGQGDMLFAGGAGRTMRVHGPFVSDEEVEGIVGYLRQQSAPRYVDGITDSSEPAELAEAPDRTPVEDLYDRAVGIILRDRKPSTSYLQRRLGVGYNRAADLIERMERDGILSAPGHQGRRQILVGQPPSPGGVR